LVETGIILYICKNEHETIFLQRSRTGEIDDRDSPAFPVLNQKVNKEEGLRCIFHRTSWPVRFRSVVRTKAILRAFGRAGIRAYTFWYILSVHPAPLTITSVFISCIVHRSASPRTFRQVFRALNRGAQSGSVYGREEPWDKNP